VDGLIRSSGTFTRNPAPQALPSSENGILRVTKHSTWLNGSFFFKSGRLNFFYFFDDYVLISFPIITNINIDQISEHKKQEKLAQF